MSAWEYIARSKRRNEEEIPCEDIAVAFSCCCLACRFGHVRRIARPSAESAAGGASNCYGHISRCGRQGGRVPASVGSRMGNLHKGEPGLRSAPRSRAWAGIRWKELLRPRLHMDQPRYARPPSGIRTSCLAKHGTPRRGAQRSPQHGNHGGAARCSAARRSSVAPETDSAIRRERSQPQRTARAAHRALCALWDTARAAGLGRAAPAPHHGQPRPAMATAGCSRSKEDTACATGFSRHC